MLDVLYTARCRRCKAEIQTDMQSLVTVTLRDRWRRPTIATIKEKRVVECGTSGTARTLTITCPRCHYAYISSVFDADDDQYKQLRLGGFDER